MKVLAIQQIQREDDGLYYIRRFNAEAVIELPAARVDTTPILFSIEKGPLGTINIDVEITDSLNYPLLPVTKALKTMIRSLDSEGKLP
ncbi:MAG: hypothetical protein LKF96_07780 [Treponema sp.]|jgi:hypothetical protein|nr:hypothetical protein [Treponema sp.]